MKKKESTEKNFEIKGKILRNGKEQNFSKEIEAVNEKFAREKLYAFFGSKNKLKRRNIIISEVKEAKGK